MNALELLEQDHRKVRDLFEQGQQTEDKKEQKQIFKEIKSELEMHARVEETIFYPAMQATSASELRRRTTSPEAVNEMKGRYGLMARYGRKAQQKVKRAMHERKRGKLKSGRSGKKVKSRKQAIAIGLSQARRAGGKVPRRKSKKK